MYHQKRTGLKKTSSAAERKEAKKQATPKHSPLNGAIIELLEYMYGRGEFDAFSEANPFERELLEDIPAGKRLMVILDNPENMDESERAKYEMIYSENHQDKTEQMAQ